MELLAIKGQILPKFIVFDCRIYFYWFSLIVLLYVCVFSTSIKVPLNIISVKVFFSFFFSIYDQRICNDNWGKHGKHGILTKKKLIKGSFQFGFLIK